MKRLTRIEWHLGDDKWKTIHADDPRAWISALKRTDEFFIVYPADPVRLLRGKKVAV